MKRLWDWFRWSPRAQFKVGSIVIIIVILTGIYVLTGCAELPTPEEIAPSQEQQELCALVYEHVRWMMARAGNCMGWTRL